MLSGFRPGRARVCGSTTIRSVRPDVESLEGRALLSGVLPEVVMDSATTTDSKSVTFTYDVDNAPLDQPVTFGVYRSANAQLDVSDAQIGSVWVGPSTRDDAGQPAGTEGRHTLTVPLPQGLTIDPAQPYVVVAADPAHAATGVTEGQDTASFRSFIVGVITHGGIQPKSWRAGVPWALRMAESLRAEGYDAVLPYNWVLASSHPGAAAKQAPRLGRMILDIAERAPAGEPVDLHLIGHSEGTVVNSLALRYVSEHETPALAAGYVKETLLDPHAANNHAPGGRQYSVEPGIVGDLARWIIDGFQQEAHDPLPVVRSDVDEAEVFYQHNPVADAIGSNHGEYNLWGQVPVPVQGDVPVHYYNLTGDGISHGGSVSVPDWYQAHVVPTLAHGGNFEDPSLLTGGLSGGGNVSTTSHPLYAGSAAPGANVHLVAIPRGTTDRILLGRTQADSSGAWTINSQTLANGTYRVIAKAVAGADPKWPRVVVMPRKPLGTLTVEATGWSG